MAIVNLPPRSRILPEIAGLIISAYENPLVSLNKADYETLISGRGAGSWPWGSRLTSHEKRTSEEITKVEILDESIGTGVPTFGLGGFWSSGALW